jgi:uracil-DNA glycosylase
MLGHIESTWNDQLTVEFEKPYFKSLDAFLDFEYANFKCYPPKESIFNAFTLCPFDQVKVVLIGQDPYHGLGQANGLAFSVNDGIAFPPSLVNIFKELENDCKLPIAISGNLERWAKQGVLLLNATLTVREGQAGSHQKQGWESFTDAVIEKLSEKNTPLVFLLWGSFAQKKGAKINRSKHCVLETGHPSPLSANRGYWFGNKHFSATNSFLTSNGLEPILW